MTEKRKVRKLLAKGVVESHVPFGRSAHIHDALGQAYSLEDVIGKNVEIVTVTDAKPEREVVVPKGAVWQDCPQCGCKTLLVDGEDRATARLVTPLDKELHSYWSWAVLREAVFSKAATGAEAQRAAEEALATAGIDGFRWKEVEPEYISYAASRIRTDGAFFREGTGCPKEALRRHDGHKSMEATTLAVLSAQDKQLIWHELDRYEAESN